MQSSLRFCIEELVVKYALALFGSLSIINLCYYFCRKENFIVPILANYGRLTLGIYLTQSFFAENLFKTFLIYIGMVNTISFLLLDVLSLLLCIFIIIVCIIAILLLSKNKFLDFVCFGGQYYRK